jgi:MFS superfamily sulfate permease-like transporter
MFSNLPEAVLGAIVIQAVAFGLFKYAKMKQIWHLSRSEFLLALAALLGVLTFGTLQGVVIGVVLSLLLLIAHASRPKIPQLGLKVDTGDYHSLEDYPNLETIPGIVILRFDGPLFFATSNGLRSRIREVTTGVEPPIKGMIFDMESISHVDLQGAEELGNVAAELQDRGVTFFATRMKTAVRKTLERSSVMGIIGEENVYAIPPHAVAAAQKLPDNKLTIPENIRTRRNKVWDICTL